MGPARRYRPLFEPGEAAVEALRRRYVGWAEARGLAVSRESDHRFAGRLRARELVLATGLGGSRPSPPEVVVFVDLEVPEPVLVRREAAAGEHEPVVVLREVLAASDDVRNLGLTSRFVRITFEPGAEPEIFDLALDALEERLRVLTTEQARPYRS